MCGTVFPQCTKGSFIGQYRANSRTNKATLAVVDGALSGRVILTWTCASGQCPWYLSSSGAPAAYVENQYDRVRDNVLTPNGYSEQQVQVAIIDEVATKTPTYSLANGGSSADAYILEANMAIAIRAARTRWPNLKQVFVNSRIYAGYASPTDRLNPEPMAYEGGFAVKWLVEAQIVQRRSGAVDGVAGDVLSGGQPWIGWTAYIWGNGQNNPPGSQAIQWVPYISGGSGGDYNPDNTHPNGSGIQKVGAALMSFFLTSPVSPWFLAH
jgi:hypothetical protein